MFNAKNELPPFALKKLALKKSFRDNHKKIHPLCSFLPTCFVIIAETKSNE